MYIYIFTYTKWLSKRYATGKMEFLRKMSGLTGERYVLTIPETFTYH